MLDDFNREVLFTKSEQFQVAEGGLLGLGLSCVSVDLDTEEVSLVLPEEFALKTSEMILGVWHSRL